MSSSNIIRVPFNKERTEYQDFNMSTCKRSVFQINTLLDIFYQPDFRNFVPIKIDGKLSIVSPNYPTRFNCPYYDTNGRLNVVIIGRNRILGRTRSST